MKRRPRPTRPVRLHRTTDPLVVSYGLIGDLANHEDAEADYDHGDPESGDPQGFVTRAIEARKGCGPRT